MKTLPLPRATAASMVVMGAPCGNWPRRRRVTSTTAATSTSSAITPTTTKITGDSASVVEFGAAPDDGVRAGICVGATVGATVGGAAVTETWLVPVKSSASTVLSVFAPTRNVPPDAVAGTMSCVVDVPSAALFTVCETSGLPLGLTVWNHGLQPAQSCKSPRK